MGVLPPVEPPVGSNPEPAGEPVPAAAPLTLLELVNFQKHRRLTVELSPGVTTITGGNGAGKSTVVRALRWLALSEPARLKVVRRKGGAKSATVRAAAGGVTVSRTRRARGGAGVYRVGGTEYKAFGREVPPAARKVLNLGPLNFHGQHDGPLFLFDPPAKVAAALNSVVNLDRIDRCSADARRRERAAARAAAAADLALKNAAGELLSLGWAAGLAAAADRLAALEADLAEKRRKRSLAADLAGRAAGAAERAKASQRAAGGLKRLAAAAGRLAATRSARRAAEKRIKEAGRAAAARGRSPAAAWAKVEKLWEATRRTHAARARLEELAREAERSRTWLRGRVRESERLEKLLAQYPRCPACGRPT